MKRPPQLRPFVLALVFTVLARCHAVKTAVDTAVDSAADSAVDSAESSDSWANATSVSDSSGSPVGKAVTLLEDLQAKVQQAQNAEQMTYMKFEMWCQLESQKTQGQIESNTQKQEELKAAIAKAKVDMKAASMHLAEIASYQSTDAADLAAATALRKKEHDAFKAMEAEILDGLKSTDAAIEKLMKDLAENCGDSATKDETPEAKKEEAPEKPPALFLQQRPSKAMKAFDDVMEELAQAEALDVDSDISRYPSLLEQSEKKASSAQSMAKVASELEQMGSSHAKEQAASSGKVPCKTLQENLELLKDVKLKSTKSLEQARTREARYQKDYMKYKEAIEGKMAAEAEDLKNTKKRLADATAMKADSEGKYAIAEADIKSAQEYLQKVGADCMDKAQQYQEQKKARRDELMALRNALKELKKITNNKGVRSQQISFVQLGSYTLSEESSKQHRPNPALALVLQRVENLAARNKSPALTQLYSRMNAMSRYGGDPDDIFKKIRDTISEMVEKLERTNREEETKKAFCDQETKNTMSTHKDRQVEASKKAAALNLASAEVASLRQEMAELSKELADIAKNDRDRAKMREDEHKAHVKAYKDLQEGMVGVQAALKALRDFYAIEKPEKSTDMAANMALASQGRQPKLDTSSVGADAGAGVIGLLEVVEENFAKNMATLQAQDRNAQESYEELVAESKVVKAQKEGDLKHKTQEGTAMERRVTELMADHGSAQQQLQAISEYMEKLKIECSVKVESREERIARRDREVKGLQEALGILEAEA